MSDELLNQSLGRLENKSDECLQRLSKIEVKVDQLERVDARKSSLWGSVWGALMAGIVSVAHALYFKDLGK